MATALRRARHAGDPARHARHVGCPTPLPWRASQFDDFYEEVRCESNDRERTPALHATPRPAPRARAHARERRREATTHEHSNPRERSDHSTGAAQWRRDGTARLGLLAFSPDDRDDRR